MKIEINNWDTYNPKRDQQTYTWLRLNNNIAKDKKLFGLDAEQRYLWICLLCEASQDNRSVIELEPEYLEHQTGVDISKIIATMDIFEEKGLTTIHDRARPRVVSPTTPTYERTNVRDERTNETNITPASVLKTKRAKADPETLRVRASLKATWLEIYRKQFGHDYAGSESALFNASLKKIHETLGTERTLEVFRAYLAWNDVFVAKRGHPIHLVMSNLHGLMAQLHRPEQTMGMVAQGRAAERVLTESEQRLAEMKLYESKRQANNPGPGEFRGGTIQNGPPGRVPEQLSGMAGQGFHPKAISDAS